MVRLSAPKLRAECSLTIRQFILAPTVKAERQRSPFASVRGRLLRPERRSAKTQKSPLFFELISLEVLENHRLKTLSNRRRRGDFCGLLMGPPVGARKSKTLSPVSWRQPRQLVVADVQRNSM
jgi:hypothetical protein